MHAVITLFDDGGSELGSAEVDHILAEELLSGNELIRVYIGWEPKWGMLSNATGKFEVMDRDPEKRWSDAGFVSFRLKEKFDARRYGIEHEFLPYMSRKERVAKGLAR